MADDKDMQNSAEVTLDNKNMDITSAYDALITEYNSRNTTEGPQNTTDAMNKAIAALEALASEMTKTSVTIGGKYRRTRRTRRTRRSRKAKRSKKTRM